MGWVGRGAVKTATRAFGSGASAGADPHGRVRALRRPGAAAEGADGGAPRGAAEHLARRRLLRLRQAWPQVAARGAPGPYGPGYPGRLARPARDAPVACGAGGAVDAAALQRRGSRPQGARALPAEAARAVADARLLLQHSVWGGDVRRVHGGLSTGRVVTAPLQDSGIPRDCMCIYTFGK